MPMEKNLLKLIKSLHVISHLPIYVFDDSFRLIHLYVADRAEVLPYDFKSYCLSEHLQPGTGGASSGSRQDPPAASPSRAPQDGKPAASGRPPFLPYLFSGVLGEVFISYRCQGLLLIIGPFTTVHLTAAQIQNRIGSYTADPGLVPALQQYLELMPYFSLGDVRDFLVHLNFLFCGSCDCPYTEDLHTMVQTNRIMMDRARLQNFDWRMFQSDYYAYRYEEQILNLVQKGDTKLLLSRLAELSNSVIPDNADDPVRSEKNYTIIILEKLANLAIQSGHDIGEVYRLRNFYVQSIEQKTNLIEVLYIRDSAIIHFTELMHTFTDKEFSPLIRSVIQYIGMHLYSTLKVRDLSKAFFVSDTTLCSKFRKETGVSVNDYIHQRKTAEAKLLLRAGVPPTEVAASLCYYDYSHFSHTFKRIAGLTPKAFQLSVGDSTSDLPPIGVAGLSQ